MEGSRVISAFLKEIDKDNWETSKNPWSFVANLNGVDIYHKIFDKHIGVLGEAFLPDVDSEQLFTFLKKAGNRVSFDKYCTDTNDIEKISPTCDVIRYYFKSWPAAPRDVVVKRYWTSDEKVSVLAASSCEHANTEELPTYLRCDLALAGFRLQNHKIPKIKPKEPIQEEEETPDQSQKNSPLRQSAATSSSSSSSSSSGGESGEGEENSDENKEEEEEEEKEEIEWINGTLYSYLVVIDPIAWIPETVMRPWSLDYPQLLKFAAEEMKNRGR